MWKLYRFRNCRNFSLICNFPKMVLWTTEILPPPKDIFQSIPTSQLEPMKLFAIPHSNHIQPFVTTFLIQILSYTNLLFPSNRTGKIKLPLSFACSNIFLLIFTYFQIFLDSGFAPDAPYFRAPNNCSTEFLNVFKQKNSA